MYIYICTIVAIASHIPLQANARPRVPPRTFAPPPLPVRRSLSVRAIFSALVPRFISAPVPSSPPVPRVLFLRGSFNRLPNRAPNALTISCALGHLLSYLEKRPTLDGRFDGDFASARAARERRGGPPDPRAPRTRRVAMRRDRDRDLCGERAGLSRFVRSSGCLISLIRKSLRS